MKISENWLREWVDPDISTAELVEQLTMAGLEVDSVEPAAPALEQVVVAEVVTCEKHPEADRLNLCTVNDGGEQPVQVICGAPNVRAGQKVVFARFGAQLPGIKIKKAKLRGVESFGMICSEQELQLSDDSSGIMELPQDAPIGSPIGDYLELEDSLIEIDLTPNRGDCLSIAGIAREVAANNGLQLNTPNLEPVEPQIDDVFAVELLNPEACPRYVGRIIRGIDAKAATPGWIKEKLRRCGLRSISPVVDITNYVLIELGQPMHGFDLAKLHGGIRVRSAEAGEQLALLDESEIECRDDSLVIADHQAAVALAGIMGGVGSSVQSDTRDILFEAAFFSPAHIAGKARSYGLHTDSSHRFERGVDPQLQRNAIERATALLIEIAGGTPGPVFEQVDNAHLPDQPEVVLRHQRLERLLGIPVDGERVVQLLQGLDMDVEPAQSADSWKVRAPSYRFDIAIEPDLIEEIGRLIGYDNIPGTRQAAHARMSRFSETRIEINRMRDLLVARGYFEAITYSFVSPEMQEMLCPGQKTLSLANPISSDMSEMRTSLLPGLMQAMKHNLNRQQQRVRLFETGLCFVPENDQLTQRNHIAGVISGPRQAESWSVSSEPVDFYDIKGDLQSLLNLADADSFEFRQSGRTILHPGQAADLLYQGQVVGFIGALHPRLMKQLDLEQPVFVFESETDCLQHSALPKFEEVSKYPSIRRDLALLVDQSVTAEALISTVKSLQSGWVQDVFVFDVYTGKEVINSRKSVALGLILQDFSRTLSDQDVEKTVSQVLQILEKQQNAVLR